GTGLINVTAAFNYLINVQRTKSIPDILLPVPKRLPFYPITTLFQGQTLSYNVTLVSSGTFQATETINNDTYGFIHITNISSFTDTTLLPVTISIPLNAVLQKYLINIMIGTNRNGLTVDIPIMFEVKKPKLQILFDEAHNGLVNQVKNINDDMNNVQDPWGKSSFLIGEFLYFFNIMIENNISVTPFQNGFLNNLSYLNKFDTVILPYPVTKLTDIFTDWWNDTTYFPQSTLTRSVLSFTSDELMTLKNYVIESHKNLIILTSYPQMHDIPELNKLLGLFNLTYVNETHEQKLDLSSEPYQNELAKNIHSIDYIGGSLTSSHDGFQGYLWGKLQNSNNYGLAFWHNPKGGNLFVSGSGFFMENLGLSSINTDESANNELLLLNIINSTSYINYNPLPFQARLSSDRMRPDRFYNSYH
ncbi:MAG: hypothetical protein ACFFD1_04135, partial [Candidatus Thorarchaeota archaeon]